MVDNSRNKKNQQNVCDTIDSYVSAWNLTEISLLVKTSRGHIYKAQQNGATVVLKIYMGEGLVDEKRGVELLKVCKHHGIDGISVILEADEDAVLMEHCDGQSLKDLVVNGMDAQATKIIAGLLNKIHACPIPQDHKFKTLQGRFSPVSKMAEKNTQENEKHLFIKADNLAKKLCSDQQDICLLHGDIYHGNIIHDSKKGWVAIDPKGYIGDRAYDVANMFLHPWDVPDIVRNKDRFLQHVTILSEHMNIDRQKIINYAFIYSCLCAAQWWLEHGRYSKHDFAMARIIDPFAETVHRLHKPDMKLGYD